MDMTPWERRQKILETLCLRRQDTYRNLSHEPESVKLKRKPFSISSFLCS